MTIPPKLHLGCGWDHKRGYLNVDKISACQPDQVCELGKFPWPWPDNTFDEIYSRDFLEHVADVESLMREAYRVLKPEGIFHAIVPYFKSEIAWCCTDHKTFFVETSFDHFSSPPGVYTGYDGPPFEKLSVEFLEAYPDRSNWKHRLRNLIPGRKYLRYLFWNMYEEIEVKLMKPKR